MGGSQRVEKGLAEFAAAAANKINHFPLRHVRGGKYIPGCVCASCAPQAHKECAKQTAILPSESPRGDFRRPESLPEWEAPVIRD